MTDVRSDIERAFRDQKNKPKPDVEVEDLLKGAAALGGGILAGRYLGKAIMRQVAKRKLAKTAIDHVKMGDAVLDSDNFTRFRSAMKRSRKGTK